MPQNNMMNDCNENESYIFISYSDKDVEMLQSIYSDLTQKGYNVLYSDYNNEKETQQKISNCTYFIALISENYISSEIYERDLQNSIDCQKDILLIFINDDMSLFDRLPERQKWRLSSIQHLRYDNGKYCSNLPFSNEHFSACLDQNRINNTDLLDSDEFGIYNGNEPYIFISYSHLDNEICDKISECFIKEGFRIWNDRGIPSGKGWDDVIGNRLNHCDSFIGLVSRNYLHSKNCIAELKRASTSNPGADRSFLIFIDDISFAALPEGTQMYLGGKEQISFSSKDWFERIKNNKVIYSAMDLNHNSDFKMISEGLDTAERLAEDKRFEELGNYLPVREFDVFCRDKKFHHGDNINAILKEGYRLLYLLEAYGEFEFGKKNYRSIYEKLSDTLNILAIRHEINDRFDDIHHRIKQLPVPSVSDIKIDISLGDEIVSDFNKQEEISDENFGNSFEKTKKEDTDPFEPDKVYYKKADIEKNKQKSANKKSNNKKMFIGIASAVIVATGIFTIAFFASTFKMPDVMYMDQSEAVNILENMGIDYNMLYTTEKSDKCGYGCVFSQDPKAGTRQSKNSAVQIKISVFEQEENIDENESIDFVVEPMRGTLYLMNDSCSIKHPNDGSETVKQYSKGDPLEIVGYVSNGYYKLLDGGYMPASNLTSVISSERIENNTPIDQTKIIPGDEITFGGYSWIVLETDGETATIMTSDIVGIHKYNDLYEDVTWENCSLREYLNNEFYNQFNSQEKSMIVENYVNGEDNPQYKTDGGDTTSDKVYILSFEEVSKYFGTESNDSTKYDTGIFTDWFWVRNPGADNSTAMGIYSPSLIFGLNKEIDSKFVNKYGCQIHYEVGIRPVIRIRCSLN